MAKSIRSKVKRRIRNCRAQHLYDTMGKQKLYAQSAKLHDPCYDKKKDLMAPPNAFVYPNHPDAQFPQVSKPIIYDFRSHKMENGGLTGVNVFRKHMNPNAKQSKYKDIVKTREQLDAEEAEAARLRAEKNEKMDESDSEDNILNEPEPMSVDQLATLAASMRISKKSKAEKRQEREEQIKISIKSKGLKKKDPFKKSKKQLLFR